MTNAADWEYASGRKVRREGNRYVWQCTHHDDGNHPDSWSCKSVADGRYYCFACGESGSILDLHARTNFGASKVTSTDAPGEERKKYALASADLQRRGIFQGIAPTVSEQPTLRDFTELEQTYLQIAHEIMHRDLKRDRQAITYLSKRGTTPLPFLGVARPHQEHDLRALAKELGDEELFLSSGLGAKSRDGNIFLAARHMIMIFQLGPSGITYWQGRSIYANTKFRWRNPKGIRKHPFHYKPSGTIKPVGAAEGFFKVAWLLPDGWGGGAFLDAQPHRRRLDEIQFLDKSVYFVDPNEAGEAAARHLRILSKELGYTFWTVRTPARFKDIDEWAEEVGFQKARRILESQIQYAIG